MRTLESVWLGTVAYDEAFELQAGLHERRQRGEAPDTLLQLEHLSVFTIGRRGSRADVLWDERTLAGRGVDVRDADRGGMVTYHGPGQLVGYPIIDLGPGADLVRYVRDLEEILIRTVAACGATGARVDGHSGVWVGDAKIAAIGVKVTRGVTKHGYALNLSCDLGFFDGIVPCGIRGRGVTSVAELTGSAPPVEAVAGEVETHFADVLGFRVVKAARR